MTNQGTGPTTPQTIIKKMKVGCLKEILFIPKQPTRRPHISKIQILPHASYVCQQAEGEIEFTP